MSLFKQIAGLKYDLSDKSREEIRQDLFSIYKDSSLLDLSRPPQTTDPYISISHTGGCSGWVSHPSPVGFDIEKTDRQLETKVLLRVSTEDELELAPSLMALWVAKEAAFKSLWRSDQPPVIAQIRVHQWACIKSNLYSFKFSNSSDLSSSHPGWVEIGERFTLGIATPAP